LFVQNANYVPSKPLPIVNVRFDGHVVSAAGVPSVVPDLSARTSTTKSSKTKPSAKVRAKSTTTKSKSTTKAKTTTTAIKSAPSQPPPTPPAPPTNDPPSPINDQPPLDGEDIALEAFLDKLDAEYGFNDADQEDAPDWMFDEGEKCSKDRTYVFCGAQHRRGGLRLFIRHFCQHPLLPDQRGFHTAEEIYEQAVKEMYTYCVQRGLAEVWAYICGMRGTVRSSGNCGPDHPIREYHDYAQQ
jgi:hypothetical protein